MFDRIRKLWRRKDDSGPGLEVADPQLFIYIVIPGDIQPIARGEQFEDPLEEALSEAGLGRITGGGSQLDDPYPDGRSRVEFCGIDVDVSDRASALILLRRKLIELAAPDGTELHYTEGKSPLRDSLDRGAWTERQLRTVMHPGFGV